MQCLAGGQGGERFGVWELRWGCWRCWGALEAGLVWSRPILWWRGAGGRIREVWVDVRRRCSAREALEGDCSWAEELAVGVRDLVFALYVYVVPLNWSGDPRAR